MVGNVLQAANGQNPGRRAALQGGVARTVPGITLNDVCLASMSAVGLAAALLRGGEAEAVLVGGFDSMTRAPHALRTRPALRMGDAPMVDVMVHDGLYCSIADAGMGAMSDAENARLGISREAQDELAARSHANAAAGADRLAEEITPLPQLQRDEGVRETSLDALAELPPAFTRDGTITAGNASQVSDGAAAAVVTTRGPRERPAGHGPRPRGRRRPGLDPAPAPGRGLAQAARRPRPQGARHRPVGDQRGVRGRRARLGHRPRHRPRPRQRQRRRGRARPPARRLRPAARPHARLRAAPPRRRPRRRHAVRRRRAGRSDPASQVWL